MTSDDRPARWLGPAVLTMEGVLALLVAPAVAVSHRAHAGRSALLVVVLALAFFVSAGLSRRSTIPGWLCQVGLLATGLLSPVMWFLGALFAAAYWGSLRLQDARPYRSAPPPSS
ncbi:MAG: hypothetical protein QOK42_2233 [Frankiaceae bacterium]|jgi:lysylphosphatidylglycerol synthetase-like protein (DUF2156 family)|nr:hypothetical protein [Frankiaceae bacterium]MDX6226334.1 hypothetical protein [Frankiales bacterium]MDX6273909.1 hypothetical protein [Frankiales bacterium]